MNIIALKRKKQYGLKGNGTRYYIKPTFEEPSDYQITIVKIKFFAVVIIIALIIRLILGLLSNYYPDSLTLMSLKSVLFLIVFGIGAELFSKFNLFKFANPESSSERTSNFIRGFLKERQKKAIKTNSSKTRYIHNVRIKSKLQDNDWSDF